MASSSSYESTGNPALSPSNVTSTLNSDPIKREQLAEAQLQTPMAISAAQPADVSASPQPSSQQQTHAAATEAGSALAPSIPQGSSVTPSSTTASDPPPVAPTPIRKQSDALGPATDGPIVPPSSAISTGPVLSISLMLTTGARHPYKIDEKYLTARKVNATTADGSFDPRELSGYQLKELIWIDWRTEWDPRPVSPSSIRLIILGRMIEDKVSLKDFPFNLSSVNVVHMTVKPADLHEDEETAGKGGKSSTFRGRDDGEGNAGCRCVIL